MALAVIGSGFGRTGTKSLKQALEDIGFAPCHHMHEIVAHPEQVAHWQKIAANKPVVWNEVFAGYRSQVDWPGAHVWRELSEAFPDAKVVHTQRPADVWWNSYSKTIGKLISTYKQLPLPPHISAMMDACWCLMWRKAGNRCAGSSTCRFPRQPFLTTISALISGKCSAASRRKSLRLAGMWALAMPLACV
jgi:Sulfotransferase domain